jgi:gentisate 1,2-dioxygenase
MRFQLAPKDLFVAPGWFPIQFEVEADLILFSYSDRIVQEKLDLFRESRGDA